ncbi:hypothetical protein ACJX0J_003268 [Zea mays]
MKVEVYILYLLVHLKGTPENRSKSFPKEKKILREIDKCLLMQELTIWFSEKTPGTLHQNKIVYEETTRKIHILIHKSYIGIEIIVNFENFKCINIFLKEKWISVFLNTLRIFPFHFSVYQMMIHSAIWKERDLCFLFINILISKKKNLDEFVASSKCTSKERFSNPLKTLKYKNEQILSKIILYTEIPNMEVATYPFFFLISFDKAVHSSIEIKYEQIDSDRLFIKKVFPIFQN